MGKSQGSTDRVDIFMPIYIGDYLKDTNRLSAAEHGAYLLLMFDYWQSGCLPDNDRVLSRVACMTESEWHDTKSTVMSYFKLVDGKWSHSRIDRELKCAKEKRKKLSERGKKGASAKWKKNASSNATSITTSTEQAMLKQCQSHSHSESYLKATTTAGAGGCSDLLRLKIPEYRILSECEPLSKITKERYAQIKRSFPDIADIDYEIRMACLKANDPEINIDRPDAWLIGQLKHATVKNKPVLAQDIKGCIVC